MPGELGFFFLLWVLVEQSSHLSLRGGCGVEMVRKMLGCFFFKLWIQMAPKGIVWCFELLPPWGFDAWEDYALLLGESRLHQQGQPPACILRGLDLPPRLSEWQVQWAVCPALATLSSPEPSVGKAGPSRQSF